MTLPAAIALDVLTGYLGAGKTTLLNRLLRSPDMADCAVIINEFGEIGIDHALVEQSTEGIVELASGCLCCTVRGDLIDTLADLIARLDDGRIARLGRIVIETTGLADPAPVLHTIMRHPELLHRIRLDAVITLVDAVNGSDTLDQSEEAVKQVAMADRLVLTKTDLATPEATARLKSRLQALNPFARQFDNQAGWPVADLIGTGLWDATKKTADVARWLGEAAAEDHHHHHDHHDHDHECGPDCDHDHGHHHGHGHHHHIPHRHDARIRSFSLVTDQPVPVGALDLFLDLMRSAHGPRLLRMKGIVRLAEDGERPLVLHAVQHVMHPPARLARWPDDDRRTRLVFITRDLDEDFVRRMFGTLIGEVATDTPAREVMADNPLAIGGFSGRFS